MSLGNLEKTELKILLKEILREDASLFKDVIKEILIENQVIVSDDQAARRKKLEAMINEDFDKYDDVFKALA